MSFSAALKAAAKAANPMNALNGESAYYADLANVERATLELLDFGATKLIVQFNPNKLTVVKGESTYGKPPEKGGARTREQDSLTCDLMFDASEEEVPGGGNVLDWLNNFKTLSTSYLFPTDKDGGTQTRRPVILFSWGKTTPFTFAGIIKTFTANITMFNANGEPMRTVITLQLQGEFMPPKGIKVDGVIDGNATEPEKASAGKGNIKADDPMKATAGK